MRLIKTLISFINALYFLRFTIKGRILPGFRVNRSDLVIDIGSGDKPFWRADVYLDKSALGSEQRYSSKGIIKDFGLFVDSDISKTPFKNKTFDFSFCSHVLEHVENPELAIKEIVRISKQGYIEVPNGIMEMICPYQSHLWFIFLIKGELIFIRKSKMLHQALLYNNKEFFYLAKLVKTPFIHLYWRDNIRYKVIDEIKQSEKFIPSRKDSIIQPAYIHSAYITLVKILRALFYNSFKKTPRVSSGMNRT